MNNTIVMFAPQIMPAITDPAGSTRHKCLIINEKCRTKNEERVTFYDDIDRHSLFVVQELSPSFPEEYEITCGYGVVLREQNNTYSWWFDSLHNE